MQAYDAGFVLIDALLAAGVLALAGTVILTIAVTGHERDQGELDRSVALVAMQSLVAQFAALDASARDRLETTDELYRYSLTGGKPLADAPLAEWRIEAIPLLPGTPLQLSFLARP